MTGRHGETLCIPVDTTNIHSPEKTYRDLRRSGAVQIDFIPVATGDTRISAGQWGNFLNRVYAVWVREDIDAVAVRLFDTTLKGWCNNPPGRHSEQADCQHCAGKHLCTPNNDDRLCDGYLDFYRYSAPFMKVMRDLKKHHRQPGELMALLRQKP